MNLIQYLFRSQAQRKDSLPASCNWSGQSGKQYPYKVYPLETALRPLAGLYIYAKRVAADDWLPIYITQTRNLHQRLEGQVTLADAVANGATHLHARYCNAGQSARCTEEQDLLHRWQPACNEVFKNLSWH